MYAFYAAAWYISWNLIILYFIYQVQKMCIGMSAAGYANVKTVECLERIFDLVDKKLFLKGS